MKNDFTPIISERLSGYGPSGENIPQLAVVHALAEYIKFKGKLYSAEDWLEFKHYSAHVLILPGGDILVTRKDSQMAHHARGFNTNSLGVEILVPGKHDYTSFAEKIRNPWVSPEQMEALVWQSLEWRQKHSLTISNFQRHSDLSPERKIDPGRGFSWGEYLAQLTLFPAEF